MTSTTSRNGGHEDQTEAPTGHDVTTRRVVPSLAEAGPINLAETRPSGPITLAGDSPMKPVYMSHEFLTAFPPVVRAAVALPARHSLLSGAEGKRRQRAPPVIIGAARASRPDQFVPSYSGKSDSQSMY